MVSPVYLRLAAFVLSITTFMLGYAIANMGLNERELTKAFHLTGIKTKATLVGYKYIQTRHHSGDRPVFSYVAKDGVQRTHVAFEHGLATKIHKKALLTKLVMITYLPSDPAIARVEAWDKGSTGVVEITMGVVLCLLAVASYLEGLRRSLNPNF